MKVTAAIIVKDNKVLIARRPAKDGKPGGWEFPGGKVEEYETKEACLRRELREELGIDARVGGFFAKSNYRYDHGEIELLAYFATWVSGELRAREHAEVRWVPLQELKTLDLLPADLPIRDKLLEHML